MKILLTSGNSFLGGRIADYFYEFGYEVTIGIRHELEENEAFFKKFKTKIINWNSLESLKEACSEQNIIIHTAGMNSTDCESNPNLAFEFNSLTSGMLGLACQYEKVDVLINLSSIHVYSKNLSNIISEESPTDNNNIYSLSKKLSENIFQEISIINHTKYINLRLSNAFGYPTNNNQACWKLFINNICKNAIQENLIIIKSNPLENRNFISISFLNKALKYIVENRKKLNLYETFNITSNKTMTLEEVAYFIKYKYEKLFSKKINIDFKSKKLNSLKKIYSSRLNNLSDSDKYFDLEIKELLYYCKSKFS